MVNAKTLWTKLLARSSEQDLGKLLEGAPVWFLARGQKLRWRDGGLRSEVGLESVSVGQITKVGFDWEDPTLTEQPVAERFNIEQPATEQPATERPPAEQPVTYPSSI